MRDRLRRRAHLVRQRTTVLLSTQNLMQRNTGERLSGNAGKALDWESVEQRLAEPNLGAAVRANLAVIERLDEQIGLLEETVKAQVRFKPEFRLLKSVAGIGAVLALTIMLETGDVHRFAKAGQYASYCRCVKSERRSNAKRKGEGNRRAILAAPEPNRTNGKRRMTLEDFRPSFFEPTAHWLSHVKVLVVSPPLTKRRTTWLSDRCGNAWRGRRELNEQCSGERVPSGMLAPGLAMALMFFPLFNYNGTMESETAVKILSALAQESRLAVFRLLVRVGPEGLPAGQIAERLGVPANTLSFHLKELSHAGLVSARPQGRFVIYMANFVTMNGLVAYLTENCCGGNPCDSEAVSACSPTQEVCS